MNSRIISVLMMSTILHTALVATPYVYVINNLRYDSRWEKDPVTGHEVKKGSPGVLIVDINASTKSSDRKNKKVNPGESKIFDLKSNVLQSITIQWDTKKLTDRTKTLEQAALALSYIGGGVDYVYDVDSERIALGIMPRDVSAGRTTVELIGEWRWNNLDTFTKYKSSKSAKIPKR